MARALGITEFYSKKFITIPFTDKWEKSFGQPEDKFKAIIYGASGNGKTEFCIQFAKYLAFFDKVFYNSVEQKISRSLQAVIIRQNLSEVAGRIIFSGEKFPEMMQRLKKKKSPNVVILDSIDHARLTRDQYHELIERFPRKIFVFVSHAESNRPKTEIGKFIEFDADIKIRVEKFVAKVVSRYGGCEDFVIWEEGARQRGALPPNYSTPLFNNTTENK